MQYPGPLVRSGIFILALQSLAAWASCGPILFLNGNSDFDKPDLKRLAQTPLFQGRAKETYRFIHETLRILRLKNSLNRQHIQELGELVTRLDLQYLVYKSHDVPIPEALLDKARSLLKRVYQRADADSDPNKLVRELAVDKFTCNPNESATGSEIALGAPNHSVLGALWILGDVGDKTLDLFLTHRLIEVYSRVLNGRELESVGVHLLAQQHAAVMAQRRVAKRLNEPLVSQNTSLFFSRFFLPHFTQRWRSPYHYRDLLQVNVTHHAPYNDRRKSPAPVIQDYLTMVSGLRERELYLESLNALGGLQGGSEHDTWNGMVQFLNSEALWWLQPEDYWDLFSLADKEGSKTAQAILATHLAVRHLRGEKILSLENSHRLLLLARQKIERYLRASHLESALLEEPLVLAAFGDRADYELLLGYFQKAKGSFQLVLTDWILQRMNPEVTWGTVSAVSGRSGEPSVARRPDGEPIFLRAMRERVQADGSP